MRLVPVYLRPARSSLTPYRAQSPALFWRILPLAKELRAQTVVHLNTVKNGGGVAEMLGSQVRFERSLGLKSHWFVMEAPLDFFMITKKIHNLLQGENGQLSRLEKHRYLEVNKKLAVFFSTILTRHKPGLVVIHDPQPLPLVEAVPSGWAKILRLHIDFSTPNLQTLRFLSPYIGHYDRLVVSNPEYKAAFPWPIKDKIEIIYPAINPLSHKNLPLSLPAAQAILRRFGLETKKPIVTQVSRFDPWKDPLGVIKAYLLAKKKIAGLQLVLAGFTFANDDPEATQIFREVEKRARHDPHIFLFADPKVLGNIDNDLFISALYTASDVIIQKSIREGFGLTMTEAMWKGKAVVAGNTSGARAQITHGVNGLLVSSIEEVAQAVVTLFKDRGLRERLGREAHFSVKHRFLLPRYILDHLRLYARCRQSRPTVIPTEKGFLELQVRIR